MELLKKIRPDNFSSFWGFTAGLAFSTIPLQQFGNAKSNDEMLINSNPSL